MKSKHLLTALLFSPVFFSCKKENTSENTAATSFAYQLKTVNPSSPLAGIILLAGGRTDANASIQWTSGTASANLLKFEAEGSGGEVEFKQNVQQRIDLFAAASVLGNISVPAGTYKEVEFKALLAPNGNAKALQLNGMFTSGATSIPVSFQIDKPVELKAEKDNVIVAAGSTYSALNSIDLSLLTNGVSETDLLNASRTNGTIILSSNANSNIYNTVLANLTSHRHEAEVNHH
ncbi:hypothetical protein [Flavisolibacter ginsenosidimutans]|uniref:DUF4382 domain-containing protein n=1 Tax=Flavisolibacter ginsenosidimutans TaxID=661481 RepID=A0A5B8UPI6_9BACT|nr:hypothetical protein [Flavisolibacter ginsenosidimutans]QEC58149.1 hypothetical protein FSB75_20310 [Flavisolibacter ginsenosidimutans]